MCSTFDERADAWSPRLRTISAVSRTAAHPLLPHPATRRDLIMCSRARRIARLASWAPSAISPAFRSSRGDRFACLARPSTPASDPRRASRARRLAHSCTLASLSFRSAASGYAELGGSTATHPPWSVRPVRGPANHPQGLSWRPTASPASVSARIVGRRRPTRRGLPVPRFHRIPSRLRTRRMSSARAVEFVLPAEPQAAGEARWSVLDVLDEQVIQIRSPTCSS